MNRLLSILILFFFPLLADESVDQLATDSLASTEGLMSSIVGGCVSAISGELILHELDLALPGPCPLLLQRTYSSADNQGYDLCKGWHFAEPTPLFYYQPNAKGIGTALVATPQGARAKFEVNLANKPKGKTLFEFVPTKGFTNCGTNKISGQNNIRNNVLSLNNKNNLSGELISGDGTVQLYEWGGTYEENWSTYKVYKETNLNRTKKHFLYDSSVEPLEITQLNWANNIVYGKFKFTYPRKAKHDSVITVESSTGKKVAYHFERKKWDNHKGLTWSSFYLNQVINPEKPTVAYAYTKSHRHPYHLVISEKSLPEGRGLKFFYYDEKDLKDRVKEIQAPIGEGGHYIATHRFTYSLNIPHGKLLNGSTDILDPYDRKTTYHYDKNERLTHVIRYNRLGQELSKDSFIFESNGNLAAKYLRDPFWNIINGRVFDYDSRGNIIRSTHYGNITGKNLHPIILGADSRPILNGTESYSHLFYYGDGNNVLAEREDNGKGIFYSYYPNSNSIASKLIVNSQDQILLREFNEYDENLFLCKKIVDDGATSDKNNLTGVTYRKVSYYYPKNSAPFGLPHQIVEKYLDLETNEEQQLKHLINDYTIEGRLISQAVFDSSDCLKYVLHWEYDAHGNVTKEINPLGEQTTRRYDKNDNLIFEENSAHGFATYYYYDLMNRLICVDEKHSDSRSFQTRHAYDLVGNKFLQQITKVM